MLRDIFLIVAFGLLHELFAQSSAIVSNRPSFTTGTYTLKPAEVVLELGYQYAFNNHTPDYAKQTAPLMDLRFGLSSKMEMDLLWSGRQSYKMDGQEAQTSFSDLAIGSKYRLIEHKAYNLSLLAILSLPTGSAPATSDHIDATAGLSWDYTSASGLLVFGIVQTASSVNNDKRVYNVQPAVGLAFTHAHGWGSFVEYFSDIPLRSDANFKHAIDAGVTYLISNDLQWDINAALGLNEKSENYVGTGLAYRF